MTQESKPSPPMDPPGRDRGGPRWGAVALLYTVAATVVIIDQITKSWAIAALEGRPPVTVIDPILSLTFVRNPGAAFGLGTEVTGLFTAVAAVVILAILWISPKVRDTLWAVALGLVLAGGVGNFIDRWAQPPHGGRGHVVDFLELPNWPVFNVADMAVVAGALGIVVLTFLGRDYDRDPRRSAPAAPASAHEPARGAHRGV